MKILYLDCFSGISGDMFIGAMLDAGLPFGILQKELSKLKMDGFKIRKRTVARRHLRGTKFDVIADEKRSHSRTLKEIIRIIDRSALDKEIKELSKKIFLNIAKAESQAHGESIAKIHFHEIGDIDSIADIVGAAIAIKRMGIERIYGGYLSLGKTAPATMNLLRGCKVKQLPIDYELVTPTGAAIFKTVVEKENPPLMDVLGVGYGAGDFKIEEIPNFLKITIGEVAPSLWDSDRVIMVETNIDDMKPMMYEHVMDRLFQAGALDVFTVPVYSKKSRIAILLSVLTKQANFHKIVETIFKETTTIGLRYYAADRVILKRKIRKVRTAHGIARTKVSILDKNNVRISPEYEDCRLLSKKSNMPLQDIYEEVLQKAGRE